MQWNVIRIMLACINILVYVLLRSEVYSVFLGPLKTSRKIVGKNIESTWVMFGWFFYGTFLYLNLSGCWTNFLSKKIWNYFTSSSTFNFLAKPELAILDARPLGGPRVENLHQFNRGLQLSLNLFQQRILKGTTFNSLKRFSYYLNLVLFQRDYFQIVSKLPQNHEKTS